MQVLLLLLLPLVLPAVAILLVRWPAIKARLAHAVRKPIIIRSDFSRAQQLLVRGSRMPSTSPSAVLTGGRHHTIISSPPSSHLWRALRHNLAAGVLHPPHVLRYAPARRHALRGLVADLRQQQQQQQPVAAAAESIRDAVFGLASTMCFGGGGGDGGVDAGVVRAMADVQTELVLALTELSTFARLPPDSMFLAVSKLIYRKRWNKLAGIRKKQEELYLPLIDGCRRRRRQRGGDDDDGDGSDETPPPSYVQTLLDLHVPAEELEEAGDEHSSKQIRKLEDSAVVGLCSEFLGQSTESTAAAVQWIMANLIKHPDIQQAVREEIDAAVDADAEEVGEELLGKLKHLNAVILEALRLHPTIMLVFRQVMEEDHVVHDGQRIPTGTDVMFLLEAMGRDKTVWADPDEFKPQRFHGCCGGDAESTATKNLVSMAGEIKMMPFGVGRRMCPAISVSLLHIGYFVANLVREFVWEEAEGEQHAVLLQTDARVMFFNRMKRPLRAHLVPRRRPEAKKTCP